MKVSSLVFNSRYLNSCNNIASMLNTHSNTHNYSTRNCNNFVLPRYRLNHSQTSFHFQAVKIFNQLPIEIKQCNSSTSFKAKLKKYFLSLY